MSTDSPHILTSYDEALRVLRRDIQSLISIGMKNFHAAARGILDANMGACQHAIVDDAEVNALEKSIDAQTVGILARFQPVAGDLRLVIASMRLASNVERISDEAKNMGRRAHRLAEAGFVWEKTPIREIIAMAQREIEDAVAAFLNGDADLARGVRAQDKILDRAYKQYLATLTIRMEEHADETARLLDLLFIVRSLERVGDHAKNIAEEAVFLSEAEDIRYPDKRVIDL